MHRTHWSGYPVAAIGLLVFVAVTACRQEPTLRASGAAAAKPAGKVSGDLVALYREYRAHQRDRAIEFEPTNPAVALVGERVVIDAVAAGDAAALDRDLRALGASDVSTAGRTISAQLPIAAIDDLRRLDSLKSARAAYGQAR